MLDSKTIKFLKAEIAAERKSSEDRAREALMSALRALKTRRYDEAKVQAAEALAALGEAQVLDDLPGFLESRAAGEGPVRGG
jgi:hypothetical protein